MMANSSSLASSCILIEYNFNLLCTLVTEGNLPPVKKLIQKLCQEQEAVVTLETFSRCSHMYNKSTPLVLAAQFDHIEIVEYLTSLIPQEEFVNIVGSVYNIANTGDELHHVTALNAACIRGYLSIAKLLVERKASLSIPDCTGSVPLCEAVFHGQYDIVMYLCEQGTDVHISNDFGWEPLHVAALRNHPKVFKCLIEHNASVDRCTPEGYTALHIAAQKGHTQIIDQLIMALNLKLDSALSSWFHGKVFVPSPLNLASAYSCGGSSQKIIKKFLDLPQCSPTHRRDAYLLIGVSCMIKSDKRKTFFYFQEAIKIIEEHSLHLPPDTQNLDVGRKEIRDSDELVEICGPQNPRSDIEMWYQALLIWERCIGLGDMTHLEILSEIAELSMSHEREVLLLTGIKTADQTLLPQLSNGYILPEFFEEFYDAWVRNCFFKSTRSTHKSTLSFSKFLPYMLKSAKTISSRFNDLSLKYGCKRRSPLKLLKTILKVFELWLKSSPSTGVESACFEMGVQFVEEFLLLNDDNTILHYILEEKLVKDLAMMEFLIQCGCGRVLNMRCKGLMCLHVACISYNTDTIGLLLKNGAHIDAVDEQGRTPLYIVQEQHSEKVSEFVSRFCSFPLSLECLSATAVLDYGLYYDFLPQSVCQFVAFHSDV